MVVDTDEFYTFNQEWDKSFGRNDSSSIENVPDVPKYVGRQNETIAHWIASGADPIMSKLEDQDDPKSQCIALPRFLFSSEVSRPEKSDEVISSMQFNTSLFGTLSFQSRDEGTQLGKPLLNAKMYRWKPFFNPHVPFGKGSCIYDGIQGKHNNPRQHSIYVHHHLGTLETYLRLNPFRSREVFHEKDKFPRRRNITDTSKTKWLGEFVQLVGSEKAFDLTESVSMKAKAEDDLIRERLQKNETVEAAYDWDEPKREISDDEYRALEW